MPFMPFMPPGADYFRRPSARLTDVSDGWASSVFLLSGSNSSQPSCRRPWLKFRPSRGVAFGDAGRLCDPPAAPFSFSAAAAQISRTMTA